MTSDEPEYSEPIEADPEFQFRGFCWFLWDAWQALTGGKLPHNCGSVDEVRNNDVFRRHCVFLDQIAPPDPLERELITAALWHVVRVADRLEPWDHGKFLGETWPKVRDELIDTFLQSDLRDWERRCDPVTPQLNKGVIINPTTVRAALQQRADNYLKMIFNHVRHIKYR